MKHRKEKTEKAWKVKRTSRSHQCNIKRTNICVIRELEGEEGGEGHKKIFNEIMGILFFSILMKTVNSEFQEAQ